MIRPVIAATAFAVALSPLASRAAEKTVVLDVAHATCELCPPIVKKSLSRVDGVKTVELGQIDANSILAATVTFDDAKADVSKLIAASTNAGYPAHLKE